MSWKDTIRKVRPQGWQGLRRPIQEYNDPCCEKAKAFFLKELQGLTTAGNGVGPTGSTQRLGQSIELEIIYRYLRNMECREFLERIRELIDRDEAAPAHSNQRAILWSRWELLRPIAVQAIKLYEECVAKQTLGRHFQPAGR